MRRARGWRRAPLGLPCCPTAARARSRAPAPCWDREAPGRDWVARVPAAPHPPRGRSAGLLGPAVPQGLGSRPTSPCFAMALFSAGPARRGASPAQPAPGAALSLSQPPGGPHGLSHHRLGVGWPLSRAQGRGSPCTRRRVRAAVPASGGGPAGLEGELRNARCKLP